MIAYEVQIEATREALRLILKIPAASKWALSVTDEDDPSSPSTLNIYTEGSADWGYLARRLGLPVPSKHELDSVTYDRGSLAVSFVNTEAS
jgi:hypothetical protein